MSLLNIITKNVTKNKKNAKLTASLDNFSEMLFKKILFQQLTSQFAAGFLGFFFQKNLQNVLENAKIIAFTQ